MGTFEEVLKSAGFLKKEKKWKAPLISLFPLEVKV
jgi:hypothetical protein